MYVVVHGASEPRGKLNYVMFIFSIFLVCDPGEHVTLVVYEEM